ncbi:MAG: ATP-binding protein, partial [Pseudomonadota bacterium]
VWSAARIAGGFEALALLDTAGHVQEGTLPDGALALVEPWARRAGTSRPLRLQAQAAPPGGEVAILAAAPISPDGWLVALLPATAFNHASGATEGRVALVGPDGSATVKGERRVRASAPVTIPETAAADDMLLTRGVELSGAARVEVVRDTAPAVARVHGFVSIEIMVMALAASIALFMDGRRSHRAFETASADAAELRRLNARLAAVIEERARVQAELSAVEADLREASTFAALGQMSAGVSHELSQPVAAMRTYLAGLRLLIREGRAEEAAETLDQVEGLVERMTAITRELKALARGQGRAGEAPAPIPVTRVDAAVRAALDGMAPSLSEAGVEVALAPATKPVPVRAERHRLEQVLGNLLQNARDVLAGFEGPRQIAVSLTAARGQVRVEVADSGPGIAPATAARIFEPFFTTKPQGEGLGLGLAISAAIAADLGGKLELLGSRRTGPCRGARFCLTLPLAERQQSSGSADAPQKGSV